MWVWEREKKRKLCRNSADRGCVARSGQHHLAGNGADFSPVLALEAVYGTDVGSNANDDGVSRWCGFPHVRWISPSPCESAVSQYRVGLSCKYSIKPASSFVGGRCRVLEPCNAKVLRTVLRGLGASNRARPLGGCVAFMGPHYLAGNGAHFSVVLKLENVCRTNE
jgi:hypothetical protein